MILTRLTLQNFALAKQLDLEFQAGFTILTGETGAGKSILMDALSMCLGERADAGSVRFGAEKADLSAYFDASHADIHSWLVDNELSSSVEEDICLRRVVSKEGRSKAWINGTSVSLGALRELGAKLVQLHSQHSQQQLLHVNYAREWLDHATGLMPEVKRVNDSYKQWQKKREEQKKRLADMENREARLAQLTFYLEELEPIQRLDYLKLEQEFDALSHYEQTMQQSGLLLNGFEQEDGNILSTLSGLRKIAEQQHGRAPVFETILAHILSAQAELEEALHTLRQYSDQLFFDPERFAELDLLLADFHRLARKFKREPQQLASYYTACETELNTLNALTDMASFDVEVAEAKAIYDNDAQDLDQKRRARAPQLTTQLTESVKTLALPEAQFKFLFEPLSTPNGFGLHHVELLFSANKGMPLQPLAKVASGGELSRITLVMQLINAKRIQSPILVFDEIDVGISGGTAEVVGRLLRDMGEQAQVLCITHQPQVAAQGHQHLLVEKLQADQASSQIRLLTHEERVEEVARMSGGLEITETTLQHARSLLALTTATP